MAEKNPVCVYDGQLKELQSGDNLGGCGSQPLFRVYLNNDIEPHLAGTVLFSSSGYTDYEGIYHSSRAVAEDFDNGNNFDISSGEFTAPIGGCYQFYCQAYGRRFNLDIERKVGTSAYSSVCFAGFDTNSVDGENSSVGISTLIYLNANDKIRFIATGTSFYPILRGTEKITNAYGVLIQKA